VFGAFCRLKVYSDLFATAFFLHLFYDWMMFVVVVFAFIAATTQHNKRSSQ
jgi:hypothetical protein